MGEERRLEISLDLLFLQTRKLRLSGGGCYQGHKGVRGKAEPPDLGERGPGMGLPPGLATLSEGVWAEQPPQGQPVRMSSTIGRVDAVTPSSAPPGLVGLSFPIYEIKLGRADDNALEFVPSTLNPRPPPPASLTGMPFPEDRTPGPELGTYIKIAHI